MTTTMTDARAFTLFNWLIKRFLIGETDLPKDYGKRVLLWHLLHRTGRELGEPIPPALLARYQRTLGAASPATRKGNRP